MGSKQVLIILDKEVGFLYYIFLDLLRYVFICRCDNHGVSRERSEKTILTRQLGIISATMHLTTECEALFSVDRILRSKVNCVFY